MAIKTVFFDLDGTLLPMEQDDFTKAYFAGVGKKAAECGYDVKKFIEALGVGVYAMVKNDGTRTNCEAYWQAFTKAYGETLPLAETQLQSFYENEFHAISALSSPYPDVRGLIDTLKNAGIQIILATNPLFPPVATQGRIHWAGLERNDFEFVTTYDNSSYCKPNLDYYRELLRRFGLDAAECLMVGNDVEEDMIAETLGMRVFLLTDHLLNRSGKDTSAYPHGNFDDLMQFVKDLINE